MGRDFDDRTLSRREIIGGAAAVGISGLLQPLAQAFVAAPAQRDLIREENRKPGTADWRLRHVWIDPATRYRSPRIEGYCSRTSVRATSTRSISRTIIKCFSSR